MTEAAKDAADVKLTARQERFCQEYMIDLNATQAAIRAGYGEKTAAVVASQNLIKLNIQRRISELQTAIQERLEISQDRIIQEYAKIAFANVTDVLEWGDTQIVEEDMNGEMVKVPHHGLKIKSSKDLPQGIQAAVKKVKQGREGLEVELHDKKGALDSIARHLGMFNDKMDVTSNGQTVGQAPTTIKLVVADDDSTD